MSDWPCDWIPRCDWVERRRHAASMAPVMSPVTSSGELCAMGLSATFTAAPQHDDPVGHGKDIGHAMADQHHRDAWSRSLRIRLSTSAIWRTLIARRRLVHQHDLRLRQARPGDRDSLALAAGHAAHEVARPGLGLQLGEELSGTLEHRAVVQHAKRTEAARQLATEIDVLRRRQVVAQRQVLVDDLDAFRARIGGILEGDLRDPAS